jgi:hypothetical protein
MKIELNDKNGLNARFTVEEPRSDFYIATCWIVDSGYQCDRVVKEFETYSAALAKMYSMALEYSLKHSNLYKSEFLGDIYEGL